MYDYWFTFGAATMDPKMLHRIVADKAVAKLRRQHQPLFQFVRRQISDYDGAQWVLREEAPSTGWLNQAATEAVRDAIAADLQKKFRKAAPPVGIMTAGRFCQLLSIAPYYDVASETTFMSVMKLAQKAYGKAASGGLRPRSPKFPALIGLCLLDGFLVQGFVGPSQELLRILREFNVGSKSPDFQIAARFTASKEYQKASHLLLFGDQSTWETQVTCEQIRFWSGNEKALP